MSDVRSVLEEAKAEVARTVKDILGARETNFIGIADQRFDEATAKEVARLEAIIRRINAVLTSTQETKNG
jgi:LmbE family N-acetylglucosaminyl deacetylase